MTDSAARRRVHVRRIFGPLAFGWDFGRIHWTDVQGRTTNWWAIGPVAVRYGE